MRLTKNRPNTIKKRGIALAVTLLMLTVLTLIVTAFFKAYQSHYSISRATAASETAAAGCESVYDYVTFRLEHDRGWGAAPFDGVSANRDPANPYISVKSEAGTYNFTGTVIETGATFQGTIYNNLGGAASQDVADVAAPNTAYCEVSCRKGDSTKRIAFSVRVAPLFDSSVLTRADLRVDASRLTMRSVDNNRNFVRAEGDIYIPDVLTSENTKFYRANGNAEDPNGMLWAKGGIHSYDAAGVNSELLDEAQELADAAESTGGRVVANAESHFSVFELDANQIDLPDETATVNLPPGRYNFVRREADVDYSAVYTARGDDDDLNDGDPVRLRTTTWVDVLEYYADPDADIPTQVFRAASRSSDVLANVGTELRDDGDTYRMDTETFGIDGVDIPGFPDVQVLESDLKVFNSDSDPDASVVFDLANQAMTASNNTIIAADGPLHLTSETTAAAIAAGQETPPPVLNLGVNSVDVPRGEAQSNAVIKAKGDLNIESGKTVGLGALISEEGDVKVQPVNTQDVDVDGNNTGGLLIFAGGDVVLSKPADEIVAGTTTTSVDNWDFNGLIYARGGIQMNGKGAESAKFTGTIVSLQEDEAEEDAPNGIEFIDCGEIEFVYDDGPLKQFVRELDGNRIQVETVFWRD